MSLWQRLLGRQPQAATPPSTFDILGVLETHGVLGLHDAGVVQRGADFDVRGFVGAGQWFVYLRRGVDSRVNGALVVTTGSRAGGSAPEPIGSVMIDSGMCAIGDSEALEDPKLLAWLGEGEHCEQLHPGRQLTCVTTGQGDGVYPVFIYPRDPEAGGAVALFAQFSEEGPPALALFDTLPVVKLPRARLQQEAAEEPEPVEPGIVRSADDAWTVNVLGSGKEIAEKLRAGAEWVFEEDLLLTFRLAVGEETRVERSKTELRWVLGPAALEQVCASLEAAQSETPLRWDGLPGVTLVLLPAPPPRKRTASRSRRKR